MNVHDAFKEVVEQLKAMPKEEFLKLLDEHIMSGNTFEIEQLVAAYYDEAPFPNNKERWKEICEETRKCPFCPKHDRENRGRRPRSDKYKNKRT